MPECLDARCSRRNRQAARGEPAGKARKISFYAQAVFAHERLAMAMIADPPCKSVSFRGGSQGLNRHGLRRTVAVQNTDVREGRRH